MPALVPLWNAYPDTDPMRLLTARQGVEEVLCMQFWEAFMAMDAAQRAAYLDQHQAPTEWRETIAFLVCMREMPDDEA